MIFENSLKNSAPLKVLPLSKKIPFPSLLLNTVAQVKQQKRLKRTKSLNPEIVFSHFSFLFQPPIRQFSMNRKNIDGKEIKVEFARNRQRKDYGNSRGRYNDRGGDRGSYRGRDDRDGGFKRYDNRDDRAPRRDFGGDRPKGCFNCGKQGHFARDCSQPRKPRQFNNGGDRDRNDRGGDRRDRRRSRSRSNDRQKKHRRRSSSSSRS